MFLQQFQASNHKMTAKINTQHEKLSFMRKIHLKEHNFEAAELVN